MKVLVDTEKYLEWMFRENYINDVQYQFYKIKLNTYINKIPRKGNKK